MSLPLPPQLLQRLESAAGFNRSAFVAVHASGKQVTSIRLNEEKWNHLFPFFELEAQVPWCPSGWYLSQRPSFIHDPLIHAGVYYVQEASSMFLHRALEAIRPLLTGPARILDLCAAPGGKTTLLSSFFVNDLVISNEINRSRSNVLFENVTKWGNDNIVVTNNDPSDFKILKGFFDVIVIDAPCSGSGLFRKDPSAIEEWSQENVNHCSQRQKRIIADILPCLKQHGFLIYSTCSYSPEEDENISDWLVGDFDLETVEVDVDAGWNVVSTASAKEKAFGYRFYPDRLEGEGFYLAVFQKKEGTEFSARPRRPSRVSKGEAEAVMKWVNARDLVLLPQQENILAIKERWVEDLLHLQEVLYLKKAGITVGAVKNGSLVPSHELAMSHYVSDGINAIEVNREQAVQYLKKKDMMLDCSAKGWNVIKYQGVNLGWIKNLHNRVNNYYPSEWRLLKD